jgi:hypothetical protein
MSLDEIEDDDDEATQPFDLARGFGKVLIIGWRIWN